MKQLYIVEPRFPDGTLNAKDPNGCFMTFRAGGVTQDAIFNYFFKNHPDVTSANWSDVYDFFATKGWKIRVKNW